MDDPEKIPVADKREALAQAVARGVNPKRASEQAGFTHNNGQRLVNRLKRPAMVARIAEIRAELISSLTQAEPLMLQLLEAANRAMRLGSAAGYSATRGLLAEVARLQSRIDVPPPPPGSPPEPPMTTEAWLAEHGPNRQARP